MIPYYNTELRIASEKVSMVWMTIARAARAAGVGVETIRFYERRGLIVQPRKPANGGFREYDAETVGRIRFIRQAQELGFSLREIEELLSLRADPNADCSEVRTQATTKRDEVRQKIAHLERIRAALDMLIAACPGKGAVTACSILDALTETAPKKATKPTPSTSSRPRKRTTLADADAGRTAKVDWRREEEVR
ncbi:MAG: MerR family DNA-binding protein [Pseudomonadota bacterium]